MGDTQYPPKSSGNGGGVSEVVAGTGVSVNSADPTKPIVGVTNAGNVRTSGNQTIGGVKTFSSSPIVPDPTNATDAAQKKWVETGFIPKDITVYDAATPQSGDKLYLWRVGDTSAPHTFDWDDLPSGEGVPAGGATGQILAKKTESDFDAEWVDPPEGGGASWGSITGTLSSQTDLQNALDGKAAALGSDDNYVTDAEKTKLSNLSGTNSGNETASTLGATINGAAAATPNDTDLVTTVESSVVKKITWTNVKAFLKTYFDTLYVALTGNQTIAGVKTFSSDPIIPDEAYDATAWNGSLEPPTKNAIRDKIESMGGGGGGTVDTVVAGTGIDVDATDPANPVVSLEDTVTNAQTGTTYTLQASDHNGVIDATNAGSKVFTFDDTATLGANFVTIVRNLGAGPLTFAADGNTIHGDGVVYQFKKAVIYAIGTDEYVIDIQDNDVYDIGVLSADHTWKGTVFAGLQAGATIAQFEAVYIGESSKWLLADANGSGTFPAMGLALAAYSDTNPARVLTKGIVRDDTWDWTIGGLIYLSATAGGLTQSAPSTSGDKVQVVGRALTADIAYFDFNSVYVTVG